MSDTPNPAPAGTESTPAPAPAFSPMNESTALEQLLALEDDGTGEDPEASEEVPAETSDDQGDEPTDEPAGEEAGEEQSEEPADDAAEPQTEEAKSEDDETGTRMHRLRDGTQVSLGDLKKAYDEARGYRQVLPQIQQERARIEQEKQAIAAQQQQFQPVIAQVATILQQQIPPAPDPSLLESDPLEFHKQRWMHEHAVTQLRAVNAAQAEAQQRQVAEAEAQRKTYLQGQQQKLVEAIPYLRDPEKAKAFNADFHEIGQAVGFAPEDLGQVFDHRLFKLAEYAIKGLRADQAQAKAKTETQAKAAVAAKKVVGKPPVAAPTARVGTGVRQAEVARGAVERLRKNPSNQDAQIAALLALE